MCKGPEVDRAWVEVVWWEHGAPEGQKMRWEVAELDQAGSVSHEKELRFSSRWNFWGILRKDKNFQVALCRQAWGTIWRQLQAPDTHLVTVRDEGGFGPGWWWPTWKQAVRSHFRGRELGMLGVADGVGMCVWSEVRYTEEGLRPSKTLH